MEITVILLMIAIGCTTYVQPTDDMAFVVLIFSLSLLGFDLTSRLIDISGFWYYICAALADLAVILTVSNLKKQSRLSESVLLISYASIIFNFIGWKMYLNGYEDILYRLTYIALYIYALYALTRGEPKNDRFSQGSSWLYSLRFNASSGHYFNHSK